MVATVGSISIDLVTNAAKFADGFKRSAVTVQTYSGKMGKSISIVDKAAAAARSRILALGAAALAGVSVNAIGRYADQWTQAGNAIAAASQISGSQVRSLEKLNDIARKSRSSFSETVDVYARLTRASKNLNASEKDIAQATETINKAFKAGGAAASEQAAGILQLGQALSSGFLQGDELRSIRENAPLLAQALADYFGTTIGQLKKLGSEGKITSEAVFKAILKATDKIEGAFKTTVPTIEDAKTQISNAFGELVNSFNGATGASEKLAGLFLEVADGIDTISAAIKTSDLAGLETRFNDILTIVDGLSQHFYDITGVLKGLGLISSGVADATTAAFDAIASATADSDKEYQILVKDIAQAQEALAALRETGAKDSGTVAQIKRIQSEIEILKGKFDQLAARAINAAEKMSFAAKQAASAFSQATGVTITESAVAANTASLPTVHRPASSETSAPSTTSSIPKAKQVSVGGTAGIDASLNQIPAQFAVGGVVSGPTNALIGEAGPEAIVPLSGGRSIPVSFGGGNSLGAIETNTAQAADYLEQAVGYLDTIDSDLVATLRDLRSAASSAYAGAASSSGTSISSGAASNSMPAIGSRIGSYYTWQYGAVPVRNDVIQGAPFSGFASGGIMNGDSQAVEFFKRPDEKVIVATPAQFEDIRKTGGDAAPNVNIGDLHFHVSGNMDDRALAATKDGIRRTVMDVMSSLNG